MTCLKPLTLKSQKLTGEYFYVTVPCGKCINCQKNKYLEWSLRLCHELGYHTECCFITLTYSDAYLPQTKDVGVRNIQLFFKRLRKKHPECRIKYFCAGEYGSLRGRLHHHAIVFGWKPKKEDIYRISSNNKYAYSKELNSLWPFGFNTVDNVTERTCGYVAKYIQKQSVIKSPKLVYSKPWTQKSQGLGARWCLDHMSEVCHDKSIRVGRWFRPVPRYYRKVVEKFYPGLFEPDAFGKFAIDRYYDMLYRWHRAGVYNILDVCIEERKRLIQLERSLVDKAVMKDVDAHITRYTRCVYPENQGEYAHKARALAVP